MKLMNSPLLASRIFPYPLERLQAAMGKDKKAQGGGSVKFVLPVKPGEVVFQALNPYDLHLDTA